jgi:chaperonin cofactor prefoldin
MTGQITTRIGGQIGNTNKNKAMENLKKRIEALALEIERVEAAEIARPGKTSDKTIHLKSNLIALQAERIKDLEERGEIVRNIKKDLERKVEKQSERITELEAEIERLLYVNYTDAVSGVSRKEKGLASAKRYAEKMYAEWAKYKKESGI